MAANEARTKELVSENNRNVHSCDACQLQHIIFLEFVENFLSYPPRLSAMAYKFNIRGCWPWIN